MSNEVIAPSRRRLTDLYVTGAEVTLNDGENEEDAVTVWLSKISPIEQRDAADKATAARAKILLVKNTTLHSEERLVYEDQLIDLGLASREEWIEFIALNEIQEAELSNQERISTEGEWAKNDYLDALQKSWNEGLADKYEADENDEEAKKVYDELYRFTQEVITATEDDKLGIFAKYSDDSDEELMRQAVDKVIDAESDFAWMNEFSRWQLYYAVREPNAKKVRYFVDKQEVDALDARIISTLLEKYREITVDPIEGKD
jgi:hypothetical protein